jgi:hypothetical protein
MWNIVSALIYFFVIVPRWRLTSRDVAEVRGAGSQKYLGRTA